MKKVLMVCFLVAGITLQAQPPGNERVEQRKKIHEKMQELTPEQRAELKTKRMTLSLDLSTAQQTEIQKLHLELETKRAERKPKEEKKGEISANEVFERASKMLDEKIAIKKKFQAILTSEQFEKFEKSQARKASERRRGMGKRKR